jgi:hypothetical protein
MSGGLFSGMLLRETGLRIDSACVDRLRRRHAAAYRRRVADIHPLPGTSELLSYLTEARIPWAIATSGWMDAARPTLEVLGVDLACVPVVTRDQVNLKIRVSSRAKLISVNFGLRSSATSRRRHGPDDAHRTVQPSAHRGAGKNVLANAPRESGAVAPVQGEKLGTIEYVLSSAE